MEIIDIFEKSTVISIAEIKLFVEKYFKKFLKEKECPSRIDIKFGTALQAVDELFYSYLLLLKQHFPATSIQLFFENQNKPYQIAAQQIYFINQYCKLKPILLNGKHPAIRPSLFREFFPQILISESFNTWFSNDVKESFDKAIRQNKTHIEEIIAGKDRIAQRIIEECEPKLSFCYLIGALDTLGVLEYYIEDVLEISKRENNKSTEIKCLSDVEARYTLLQQKLFNSSECQLSTANTFFFALLVYNNDNNSYKNESGLSLLIEQTKQISYALNELAKNILEHTDQKFGVISGRVHKGSKLDKIKVVGKREDIPFSTWLDQYKKDDKTVFLDINVIDSGFIGIRKKYISKINKFATDSNCDIQEDINTLQSDDYDFGNFLDYTNIRLVHQVNRANARIGLLTFSNFVVDQKKGFIKVASTNFDESSKDVKAIFQKDGIFHAETTVSTAIPLGTNYNFIIPITLTETRKTTKRNFHTIRGTEASTLNQLFRFTIEDDHTPGKIIPISLATEDKSKYGKIAALKKTIIQRCKDKKIALLNAEETGSVLENPSDWIRLLGNIQLLNDIPVIVYGIKYDTYKEIVRINKIFDKSMAGFWNDKANALFYIKRTYYYNDRKRLDGKERQLSLWLCNVFSGKTYESYLNLNKSISLYHHNLFRIEDHPEIRRQENIEPDVESDLFSENGKLLNFELLIRNQNGLSLFEESVKSLLELEICTLPDLIKPASNEDQFFLKYKGYKVSDSHFKLGSKIHIDKFYYAKRMFYNSFYANRFAFLIARYIINMLLGHIGKEEGFTLIGYSHYSELLVSNVRQLLTDYGYSNVNHDIALENGKILKNAKNIHEKIIIIVPISSTFSTSHKIRKSLSGHLQRRRMSPDFIKDTDISVLLVADQSYPDLNLDIYKNFGWREILNDNDIKVDTNETESIQHFFIQLKTSWQRINECSNCFPKEGTTERCLLETGANNITPETVFGFPIVHHSGSRKLTYRNFYELKDNNIRFFTYHKHLLRDNLHFNIYIKAASFLHQKENHEQISSWLRSLKEDFVQQNILSKNILIITPSKNANAGFANAVNRQLFDDTATILQYSATDDTLQNFIYFNSSFFKDSAIFFVDDVLYTGQTFHKINNIIESIPYDKMSRRIDFCLCMIDRMNFFDRQYLIGNLSEGKNKQERLLSFSELNLPPVEINNFEFPNTLKERQFRSLAEKSVTDVMKLHFFELSKRVAPFDLDRITNIPDPHPKDLFHFLVYQSLYDLFEIDSIEENFSYKKIRIIRELVCDKEKALESLVGFVKIAIADFLTSDIGIIFGQEVETKIIYLCSTPPFSYYKDIREFASFWVYKRLKGFADEFISRRGDCSYFTEELHGHVHLDTRFIYTKFETFKLYLRLAVELKMNYIFSPRMFEALQIVLDFWKKPIERRRCVLLVPMGNGTIYEFKKDWRYAIGFITYYTGMIEQIVYNDEAKALKLVGNIQEFLQTNAALRTSFGLRKKFNDPFINLLRKLVIENTFIFEIYHENFYKDKISAIKGYTFDTYESLQKLEDSGLYNELINYQGQSSRFTAMQKMWQKDNGTSDDEKAFFRTMHLKTILRNEIDSQNKAGKIDNKVKIILREMCEILDISKDKCNGGAFFTVRFQNLDAKQQDIKSEDLYNVARFHTQSETSIDNPGMDEQSVVYEFYKGIKEYHSKKPKSVLELLYNPDQKKYESNKCIRSCDNTIIDFNNHAETTDYKNFLFLRICDILPDLDNRFETNPLAVICFYRCKIESSLCTILNCSECSIRINPKRIRFLMLLKDDLHKFVKYQVNDSFRSFVEQDRNFRERLLPQHNHTSNLKELSKSYFERDDERFDFFFKMFYRSNDLTQLLESKTILPNDLQPFNVREEIDICRKYILSDKYGNFKQSDDNLSLCYPKFVFRAIICEYMRNVKSKLDIFCEDILKESPSFDISFFETDNFVTVILDNNASTAYEAVDSHREILKNEGCMTKEAIKGLYLNSSLLQATGCPPPSIDVITENEGLSYHFIVTINLKKYA